MLPPPNAEFDGVLYNYGAAANGVPAQLNVASARDIRSAAQPFLSVGRNTQTIFNVVPKLQTCARGVTVDFASVQGLQLALKKPLQDGRTAYIYTESGCYDKDLAQYVEQINSY